MPSRGHEAIEDPASSPLLAGGIELFNAGKHWHAHEEWEHLWLGLDGEDKRFVQGLIMAAAMLVQYGKGIRRGVVNHYRNTVDRLTPHAPTKWGVDVVGLLEQLAPFEADAADADVEMARAASEVQIRRF